MNHNKKIIKSNTYNISNNNKKIIKSNTYNISNNIPNKSYIELLPVRILKNIIFFLRTTKDYLNLRSTNAYFYDLMLTIKIFQYNYLKKEIKFNSIVNSYEVITYDYNNSISQICYYDLLRQKKGLEKYYFKNKQLSKISNYKYGSKHGLEKIYFINNILKQQTQYRFGKKINNEFINNIDGTCKFIITYKYNIKTVKKFIGKNLIYNLNFLNNKIHGINLSYDFEKLKRYETFHNGYYNGTTKFYNFSGINEIYFYENNKKNGIYLKYNILNNINTIANYKNNKLDGNLKIFSNDKIYKTINLKNGLLNGKYIEYKNEKNIFNFKNNLLNDFFEEYDINNILRYKINFSNNKFNNIYKKYNYNGELDIEVFFINYNDYIVKKYEKTILKYIFHKIKKKYFITINNTIIKLN